MVFLSAVLHIKQCLKFVYIFFHENVIRRSAAVNKKYCVIAHQPSLNKRTNKIAKT